SRRRRQSPTGPVVPGTGDPDGVRGGGRSADRRVHRGGSRGAAAAMVGCGAAGGRYHPAQADRSPAGGGGAGDAQRGSGRRGAGIPEDPVGVSGGVRGGGRAGPGGAVAADSGGGPGRGGGGGGRQSGRCGGAAAGGRRRSAQRGGGAGLPAAGGDGPADRRRGTGPGTGTPGLAVHAGKSG